MRVERALDLRCRRSPRRRASRSACARRVSSTLGRSSSEKLTMSFASGDEIAASRSTCASALAADDSGPSMPRRRSVSTSMRVGEREQVQPRLRNRVERAPLPRARRGGEERRELRIEIAHELRLVRHARLVRRAPLDARRERLEHRARGSRRSDRPTGAARARARLASLSAISSTIARYASTFSRSPATRLVTASNAARGPICTCSFGAA